MPFLLVGCTLSCAEVPVVRESPALRIALHGDPAGLDPHLQNEVVALSISGHIYEGLVRYDANMGILPALADHWENLDPLTLRLHLRPNLTFHDGRALSAEDVVYSFRRAREHPRSKSSDLLVAIESVRAIHETTVEIRTYSPYPILLHNLVFLAIVPRPPSFQLDTSPISPDVLENLIGTGPYRLERFVPGESLTLQAWDEYRDGMPEINKVDFLFVSDSARRTELLLNKEIDLADDLRPEDVERVTQDSDLQVRKRSSVVVYYLQTAPDRPPFDDPRVRRAIDLALDRRELVESLLQGFGEQSNQLISADIVGYHPDLPTSERDLDASRKLLAEAGFGQGMQLDLEYRDGLQAVPLIQAQLAEVGIRVRLVPQPWSELYRRLEQGEVAFYAGGWANTSSDVSDLFDGKIHCRDPQQGYGASNFNRFCDPEIDALIEEAGRSPPEPRNRLLAKIAELLADQQVFLPLYSPWDLYGLSSSLEWSPRQDGRIYAFEMKFPNPDEDAP